MKPCTSSFCCTTAELLITCFDSVYAPPSPRLFSPVCFLQPVYLFNRPCVNQIGNRFWVAVCVDHGIGGSGEYCGDNEAYLDLY
jgi:hypothetical protein